MLDRCVYIVYGTVMGFMVVYSGGEQEARPVETCYKEKSCPHKVWRAEVVTFGVF
jgi:hypothetical protein